MSDAPDLPIHPLQATIDGLTAAWQTERANSQMTLGALIEAPPDSPPRTSEGRS